MSKPIKLYYILNMCSFLVYQLYVNNAIFKNVSSQEYIYYVHINIMHRLLFLKAFTRLLVKQGSLNSFISGPSKLPKIILKKTVKLYKDKIRAEMSADERLTKFWKVENTLTNKKGLNKDS